jgi:hypothetical protein
MRKRTIALSFIFMGMLVIPSSITKSLWISSRNVLGLETVCEKKPKRFYTSANALNYLKKSNTKQLLFIK